MFASANLLAGMLLPPNQPDYLRDLFQNVQSLGARRSLAPHVTDVDFPRVAVTRARWEPLQTPQASAVDGECLSDFRQ